MIDHNFDPYAALQELQNNQLTLANQVGELARQLTKKRRDEREFTKALLQHRNIIEELIEQLNANTEEINRCRANIESLHGRITLLEVARQHETSNNQNRN